MGTSLSAPREIIRSPSRKTAASDRITLVAARRCDLPLTCCVLRTWILNGCPAVHGIKQAEFVEPLEWTCGLALNNSRARAMANIVFRQFNVGCSNMSTRRQRVDKQRTLTRRHPHAQLVVDYFGHGTR
jgi:hypothetical protein